MVESNPRPSGTRLIKSPQAARLASVLTPLNLNDMQREADAIVATARRSAAETLRHADETARRTIDDARAQATGEADALRREAYEKGLQQGRDDGRREVIEQTLGEAREQFTSRAAQAVKLVDELAAEWQLRRRQLFIDSRQDVATLAIAVARRLAPRLGELDPGIATDTFAAALSMLGQVDELVIRVHPAGIDAVKQFAEQTFSGTQAGGGVRWVPDESVVQGGVRLESRAGAIDAGLPRQVERIADDLLTGWRDRIAIFEGRADGAKSRVSTPDLQDCDADAPSRVSTPDLQDGSPA